MNTGLFDIWQLSCITHFWRIWWVLKMTRWNEMRSGHLTTTAQRTRERTAEGLHQHEHTPQQFEAEVKEDKYYSAMMSISLQQRTRLHEMKWMRDLRSTKKLDLLYHHNCSRLIARGGKMFPPFFRCIVVILSCCCQQLLCCRQQSLLGCHADVLPLLFVVSLSLIVTSGRYLLALQLQCLVNYKPTKGRLRFPCHSILLSSDSRQLLLGCLVIVAKVIKGHKKLLHFMGTFAFVLPPNYRISVIFRCERGITWCCHATHVLPSVDTHRSLAKKFKNRPTIHQLKSVRLSG